MEQKQASEWPGGTISRLPVTMRLAARERDRLWKGLERFVNCSDSLEDCTALGRAFPSFWPATLHYWVEHREGTRIHTKQTALDWNPTCHKLFLVYRDTLRRLWLKEKILPVELIGAPEFLLGTENEWHRLARESAESAIRGYTQQLAAPPPSSLADAWKAILEQFPNSQFGSPTPVRVTWPSSEIGVFAQNEMQRAFYVLFRENWRARVCPRCKIYFIARKPKQIFCGTVCSAGNRLASKLKWWNRTGAKRRASQKRTAHKGKKTGLRRTSWK
jgi:hypothetical protein